MYYLLYFKYAITFSNVKFLEKNYSIYCTRRITNSTINYFNNNMLQKITLNGK